MSYLLKIDVVVAGQIVEAPGIRVRERFGKSDDMNHGFGGKYVWLSPVFTSNKEEAATSVEFFVQSEKNSKYVDLATGAGGDYRYLKVVSDPMQPKKIVDLRLIREDQSYDARTLLESLGEGWAGVNFDINQGRGKTYLWLAWKLA